MDGTAALSPSPWGSAVRSWHPGYGQLVKHPMGKGAFLCCNMPGRHVGLQAWGWAAWATKLDAVGCGDFSGNFKEFLELELLWGLH